MAQEPAEKRSRLERILAPLHAHAESQGYSEEQLAEVFEQARNEVFKKKVGGSFELEVKGR